MDEQILEVLQDIRSEAKLTNERLESLEATTNAHFESLEGGLERIDGRLQLFEGRFDFLEKRVSAGFENVAATFKEHSERIDDLHLRQITAEVRLQSEIMSVGDVMREIRDLLATKLEDHDMVRNHEDRIRVLEDRVADKDEEP